MSLFKKAGEGMNNVKTMLAQSGISPRKHLGQHFLQDRGITTEIIAQARLDQDDVVLEVGSGLGALTIPALSLISHLVAVEKDPDLVEILKERVPAKEAHKITTVLGDILKVSFEEVSNRFQRKIKVLGNLPYNISSPFLEKLVSNRKYVRTAILMFQHEFAQRLTARPCTRHYGALSVIMQYHARLSPLIKVSRDAFYPKPKVDSMVVEIDFEEPNPSQAEDERLFQQIVKAAFSHRRKTILNSLDRGMVSLPRETLDEALRKCSIDPKRRAETLTVDDYIRLNSALRAKETIP
jgi:16S rRNA (adenine1518-N6/adenine1519-N6)-dimethyltransferase